MGCGGSRLHAERESVPAKFRPVIRRKIEEIRRRRPSGLLTEEATPSKKELLRNGKAGDDDHHHEAVLHNRALKSVSTPEDSTTSCVTSEGSIRPAKREDKAAPVKHESTKAERNEKMGGNDEGEDDEEGKYEEDDLSNKASLIFPGSPSFRVYFVDNLHEEDDNEGKKDGANLKTQSSEQSTSLNKNFQESLPKKARKRGSLKKVMPSGGQSTVKSLFNVRACYTPSSHDRAHLLTGKTTA